MSLKYFSTICTVFMLVENLIFGDVEKYFDAGFPWMCFQCTLRKISCFGSRISYPSQKSKASCRTLWVRMERWTEMANVLWSKTTIRWRSQICSFTHNRGVNFLYKYRFLYFLTSWGTAHVIHVDLILVFCRLLHEDLNHVLSYYLNKLQKDISLSDILRLSRGKTAEFYSKTPNEQK